MSLTWVKGIVKVFSWFYIVAFELWSKDEINIGHMFILILQMSDFIFSIFPRMQMLYYNNS